MTHRPLTLEGWHQFIRDSGADPVFHRLPSDLMRQLRDDAPLEGSFDPYFQVVKKSAWKNELVLILASFFLQKPDESVQFDGSRLIDSAAGILNFASLRPGKDYVRKHPHWLKYYRLFENGLNEVQDGHKIHYDNFLYCLQKVEAVSSHFLAEEKTELLKFRIDLSPELAYSDPAESSLKALRSLLPDQLKTLSGTVLDKNYEGRRLDGQAVELLMIIMRSVAPSDIPALIVFMLINKDVGVLDRKSLEFISHYAKIYEIMNNGESDIRILCHSSYQIDISESRSATEKIHSVLAARDDVSHLAGTLKFKPSSVELKMPHIEGLDAPHAMLSDRVKLDAVILLEESSKLILSPTMIEAPAVRKVQAWRDIFPDYASENLRDMCEELLPISSDEDEYDSELQKLLKFLRKSKKIRWFEHFVVSAVCLTVNRGQRPNTVLRYLSNLRRLLNTIPEHDVLLGTDVLRSLEAELSDGEAGSRRKGYLMAYLAACQARQALLINYPRYRGLLLNTSLPDLPKRPILPRRGLAEQARRADARRDSIDQIAEHWHLLHQQADRRYIALRAVILAVRQVIGHRTPAQFTAPTPVSVTIPETQATWHFTIWTKGTFHHHVWDQSAPPGYRDQFFLEYHHTSGEPDFWAADICRAWVNTRAAEQFEQVWRYPISRLSCPAANVLGNGRNLSLFLRSACAALAERRRDVPCVFDFESLYRGVLFGTLALRIGRYGGHRGHELIQLKANDDDLLVRLHRGRELMLMRFYPKGQKGTRFRAAEASYKVITVDALRVMEAVDANRRYRREEMDSKDRDTDRINHVFRVDGKVLSVASLNACLRFLLHGLLPPEEEAEVVLVRTHLMRYGFAVHARANGVHLNDLAMVMNHRNPAVTERYGRATQRQALQTLASVAMQSGMWSNGALPDTTRGVLKVPGGQCTYLAECHDTRACVGCAFKRPEPAARAETEHVIQTLEEQVAHARGAGWQDTRRLTKELQYAAEELNAMDVQQTLDHVEAILDKQERQILQNAQRRSR